MVGSFHINGTGESIRGKGQPSNLERSWNPSTFSINQGDLMYTVRWPCFYGLSWSALVCRIWLRVVQGLNTTLITVSTTLSSPSPSVPIYVFVISRNSPWNVHINSFTFPNISSCHVHTKARRVMEKALGVYIGLYGTESVCFPWDVRQVLFMQLCSSYVNRVQQTELMSDSSYDPCKSKRNVQETRHILV